MEREDREIKKKREEEDRLLKLSREANLKKLQEKRKLEDSDRLSERQSQYQQYKSELDKNINETIEVEFKKLIAPKENLKTVKEQAKEPSGIMKPVLLTKEACKFFGLAKNTQMARTEVTKLLTEYIKLNNLQDPIMKKNIIPNETLKTLLKIPNNVEITYFSLQKYLKPLFANNSIDLLDEKLEAFDDTFSTVLPDESASNIGDKNDDNSSTTSKNTRRKTIPKAVKVVLWNKYFGEDVVNGSCYVCSRTLKVVDFEAGHITSVTNGGSDNIDNLMPICSLCNKSVGTMNLIDFKNFYIKKPVDIMSDLGDKKVDTPNENKKIEPTNFLDKLKFKDTDQKIDNDTNKYSFITNTNVSTHTKKVDTLDYEGCPITLGIKKGLLAYTSTNDVLIIFRRTAKFLDIYNIKNIVDIIGSLDNISFSNILIQLDYPKTSLRAINPIDLKQLV
jgi:chromatin remodeling complex protein RSC6